MFRRTMLAQERYLLVALCAAVGDVVGKREFQGVVVPRRDDLGPRGAFEHRVDELHADEQQRQALRQSGVENAANASNKATALVCYY